MCPFSKTPFHKLLGLEFFSILNKNGLYPKAEKMKAKMKQRLSWFSIHLCLTLSQFMHVHISKVSWDNIQIYLPLEERQKNWFWVQCWLDIGTLQRLVTEWIWFGASKRLCPQGGERWNAGRPWRSARRWWERAGQLYGSMRPEKQAKVKLMLFLLRFQVL